ncbi:MAG: hypothetical protein KIT66_01040 [Chitinophagaceae bacterium]|nr:hypothetical protein [Chitinophagaceae bacterium]
MKRNLYALFLSTAFLIISHGLFAQSKTVKTAQKANEQVKKVKEDADEVTRQAGEIGNNINAVKANAKTVVSIFEPILKLRLKKNKDAGTQATNDGNVSTSESSSGEEDYYSDYGVTEADIMSGMNITTESIAYNTDGTANLGSQNNNKFGCYLNMVNGEVMDDIDAAGNSKSIDLIFTATGAFNEQVPMYAFLTPAYVKDDRFAYNFFKGIKYKDQNIPPASWEEVNESEVAMTTLTQVQFDKIQNNNQLTAVVKQIKGFGPKVESRTKLDGKVIAVKTEMGDRTAYGLIYITNHYGTTGSNGYLKIKIKVTGFDSNGDGNPDPQLYNYSNY